MLKSAQILFEPFKLGSLALKSRFMRPATFDAVAGTTGLPKPLEKEILGTMADNGVALIMPGFMYVVDEGRVLNRQLGMSQTAHAQVWEPIIKSLHEKGTKIVGQIVHGGLSSDKDLYKDRPLIGASATMPNSREITIQEIEEVIQSYITAAVRLQNIDADGIQLHCAGDFLFSQFLHPQNNQRTDKYGGNPENRLRIVKEIVAEIKKVVSPEFSVSLKIKTNPAGQHGTPFADTLQYLNMLKKDIDFAEVMADDIIPLAPEIRQKVQGLPLAMTGNIRKLSDMADLVNNKYADVVGLSRPLIRQPDFVNLMKLGKTDEADCINCDQCFSFGEGKYVRCHQI